MKRYDPAYTKEVRHWFVNVNVNNNLLVLSVCRFTLSCHVITPSLCCNGQCVGYIRMCSNSCILTSSPSSTALQGSDPCTDLSLETMCVGSAVTCPSGCDCSQARGCQVTAFGNRGDARPLCNTTAGMACVRASL